MKLEALQDFYNEANPESLQHVRLKINPHSFLDVLQVEIRGYLIKYASKKKRERQEREVELCWDIELPENQLNDTLH